MAGVFSLLGLSCTLLFVFTKLLQKVLKSELKTSAISVKKQNDKCIVRVEKTR